MQNTEAILFVLCLLMLGGGIVLVIVGAKNFHETRNEIVARLSVCSIWVGWAVILFLGLPWFFPHWFYDGTIITVSSTIIGAVPTGITLYAVID